MAWLDDGELIRDTLEVERLLGVGAFAEVYRIRDRLMRRRLAMKVFKSHFSSVEDLETTMAEPRLLSGLEHRNIVRIFEAGWLERGEQSLGYFTMEYVAGGDLDNYWRAYGARLMPVIEAVEIIAQSAEGLACAHALDPPVVHRDIKPQNILIGYDGSGIRVKLGDFGLARHVSPITLFASAKGTLAFKAPEAFQDVDHIPGDIWSLGTTLYLLLTDQLPYPELAQRGIGNARSFLKSLKAPSRYNFAVNAALDAIVMRCLAVSPKDRYGDAADLARDLRDWRPNDDAALALSSRSLEAPGPTSPTKTAPRSASAGDDVEVMIREAFKLAKSTGRLETAADLLEQALTRKPDMRDRHETRLRKWRQGIWM